MKCLTLAGFSVLLFAMVSAEGLQEENPVCTEESVGECASNLDVSDYDFENLPEFCRVARRSINCMQEIANECSEELGDDHENLVNILDSIKALCGTEENGEEFGCLKSKDHIANLVRSCAAPAMLSLTEDPELSREDNMCILMGHLVDCTGQSISEACTPFLGTAIAEGMKEELKASQLVNTDSEKCQEIFGGEKKKRSLKVNLSSISKWGQTFMRKRK